MTKEERIFIETDDLTEIELTCGNQNCGSKARVSLSLLGDSITLPYACPSCNEDWFIRGSEDPNKNAILAIRKSLKTLQAAAGILQFKVRFRVHVESVQ
jgi:hypothetical protein